MDSPPTSDLRIYLLGRFQVMVGNRAIEDSAWRRERAASLIKMLALAPRARLHREQVMEMLWPDSAPRAGANALHQVIHVARQILRSHHPVRFSLLQLQNEVVSLASTAPLWVDAQVFESSVTEALRGRDPGALQSALDLYRGDLLPDDPYQEWTVSRRAALQRLQIEALLELADIEGEAGEHGKAIATLRRVLLSDPAHEEAHAALMRNYALSGQRYTALKQYQELREALSQELGAMPGPVTQRLYGEIENDTLPLADRSVVRSDTGRPSTGYEPTFTPNLPREVNSFVGRSHDVAEVCALLSGTRILTLIGAGGCGKTRLAVRIATVLRATDPIAIPFIDLSNFQQASLAPQAVAATLGIAEQSDRPILDTVIDHLRSRRLILLLDNCEHMIDACARLVQTLVDSCPHLRVLCTSREPLRIPGELVWRVSSLALPDPQHLPSPDTLLEYESVRLFVDRARTVSATFAVTEANARSVAQLCCRLDGIPLALELAAARAAMLSPEQIVERLDDCFTLLSLGSRTAMSRQQTMKALFDWSYDLLTDGERTLFRRLAVFTGTFHLSAVEAIAGADDLAAGEVLDLLQHLVDKSLVVPLIGDEQVRYRLLEPIRQYAALQLDASGEAASLTSRHVDWYLQLARAADGELWGGGHGAAVARLEQDRENIRSALAWCTAHDTARGLQLAHTQWQFWLLRGYLVEGRRAFDHLLEDASAPPAARARGLLHASALATRQGNYGATTTAHIEGSMRIYRDLGDRVGLAQATHQRAIQSYMRGAYAEARAYFEQSCDLSASIDFTPGRALAIYGLGIVAWAQGAYDAARASLEGALVLFDQCQDTEPVSTSFLNVALIELPFGSIDRAITVQEETWVLLRRIEAPVAVGYTLANLGGIARLQGARTEAASYLERSVAAFTAVGDSSGLGQALGQQGNYFRWIGEYGRAHIALEGSLALRRELGERRGAGRTLNNLGMLAVQEGQTERARDLFAESMSLFREMGDKPGITATHENQGHLRLLTGDAAAAQESYEHGLAMSHDMGSVSRGIACNLRHRGLAELMAREDNAARASFAASRTRFLDMGDVTSVATLDLLLNPLHR